MNTSFNVVAQNLYDRNFGGTLKGTADPYLSGTHFIKFYDLPSGLIDSVKTGQGNANFGSNAEISQFLQASCLSVTPPGGTLGRAEFTGLGGIKWGVPTNVDYGNTITVKFVEFSALPVLAIMHGWVRMIREYRNGISRIQAKGPSDYKTKNLYACNLLYWTTKPDGLSVEYFAMYSGIYPTKDPQDLFSSDVATVDKLEPDVEFALDFIWHEDWVRVKATEQAKILHDNSLAFRGAQSGALQSAPAGADSPS
jgi:hypothetical protein